MEVELNWLRDKDYILVIADLFCHTTKTLTQTVNLCLVFKT